MALTQTPLSARSNQSIPFLPGYGANTPRQNNPKKQTLGYGPGGAVDNLKMKEHTTYGGEMPKLDLSVLQTMADPHHRYNQTTRSITHDEREAIRESARNTYRPAVAPAWLKHDRQVLRFHAYFQEPVHENPMENYRVRKCTIYFYLEDGTMMISEPKIENSGILQGTFVKRHRIPKPQNLGGGYYTHQDLQVGTNINIYSRVFRIVDADDFTREFCDIGVGTNLEPKEEAPLDAFTAAHMQEWGPSVHPKSREIAEGKEYTELALGGNRKNAKLQQYLENDRKVLHFKCFWDDPTRYGSRIYYTMHYYLKDDTVEILECLPRNSGRDPYPVFWQKAPLDKKPHVNPAPGMLEPQPNPYRPQDLLVGETFDVYGRHIFLYDCDEFTREFYRKYMKIEQDSMEIREPNPLHVQLSHPPHTGFGAEDDSLASCKHLTPRPPRRDINKLMVDSEKVMRFEATMANGTTEDKNRIFIVKMYLADDSVGVWEKRQRNSGHTEGKFALRSKKQNTATGTWFQPADFYVGATVEINSTPFLLKDADEGTLRYMEEHCDEFAMADVGTVASKLYVLQDELSKVEALFLEDFQNLALQNGVKLTAHELFSLARAFGEPPTPEAPGCIYTDRLLARLR